MRRGTRRSNSPFVLFVSAVFCLLLGAFFLSPPESNQAEPVILTSTTNTNPSQAHPDSGTVSPIETRQGLAAESNGDAAQEGKGGAKSTARGESGAESIGKADSNARAGESPNDSLADAKASVAAAGSSQLERGQVDNSVDAGDLAQVDCGGVLDSSVKSDMALYCTCFRKLGAPKPAGLITVGAKVDATAFSMNVYAYGDIVSGFILKDKWWELETSRMFVKTMNAEYEKRAQADPGVKKSDLTFLDIGANLGWYSLLMAAEGFRVIAVEPMTKNHDALKSSICLNGFQDSITVHKTGLSEVQRDCAIVSDVGNTGDGIIVCDDAWSKSNYRTREVVHISRLDDLIPTNPDIVLAKIDVEGYEDHVLGGANKTLLNSKISKVMSEFSPRMMGDAQSDPVHYLKTWSDAGYTIRERAFGTGPIIAPSLFEAKTKAWRDTIVNLFIERDIV